MDKNSLGIPPQYEKEFQAAFNRAFYGVDTLDDIPKQQSCWIIAENVNCNNPIGKALINTLPLCKRFDDSVDLILLVMFRGKCCLDDDLSLEMISKYFEEYFNNQFKVTDEEIVAILDPNYPYYKAIASNDGNYYLNRRNIPYSERWIFCKVKSVEVDDYSELLHFEISPLISFIIPELISENTPITLDLPNIDVIELPLGFSSLNLVKSINDFKKESFDDKAIESILSRISELYTNLNNFNKLYHI